MDTLVRRADLAAVKTSDGDEDRGTAIKRRFDALGISDREWHAQTGIDRKTLNRAIENLPTVRSSTYDAIETNLDKLERLARGEPVARMIGDPDEGMVEFTVEGNFGVRAVVKGPVRDIDALREAVARLMEGMGSDDREG